MEKGISNSKECSKVGCRILTSLQKLVIQNRTLSQHPSGALLYHTASQILWTVGSLLVVIKIEIKINRNRNFKKERS